MIPARLKRGATIGLVAPSNPIGKYHAPLLKKFEEYMNQKGFKLIYAKNAKKIDKFGASGGTPEQRAEDINSMFKEKKVQAIWCVQGGDTANEILELLDYDLIKKNPKIFMGKSDIDQLLLVINKKTGLVTFHVPDSKLGRGKDMDFGYSKKFFEERLIRGKIGDIKPATEWKCVRKGKAKGKILGCNINSILKLAGTEYFPDFTDSILFLEDFLVGKRLAISNLVQLRQVGVFDKINGMVIGHVYGFQNKEQLEKDPKLDIDGKKIEYEDLVSYVTKDHDFPVLKINEFGHYFPNLFLPIGVMAEMDATNKKLKIVGKCVET